MPGRRASIPIAYKRRNGASQSVVALDSFGRIDASLTPVKPLQDGFIGSITVTRSRQLVTLQVLARSPGAETWVTRHLHDGSLDPAFGSSGSVFVGSFTHSGSARIAPLGMLYALGRQRAPAGARELRERGARYSFSIGIARRTISSCLKAVSSCCR